MFALAHFSRVCSHQPDALTGSHGDTQISKTKHRLPSRKKETRRAHTYTNAYGKTGIHYQSRVAQSGCGMSGWAANVNGCLSYIACSYQSEPKWWVCAFALSGGLPVINLVTVWWMWVRLHFRLRASAAGCDVSVLEITAVVYLKCVSIWCSVTWGDFRIFCLRVNFSFHSILKMYENTICTNSDTRIPAAGCTPWIEMLPYIPLHTFVYTHTHLC